MIPLAYTIRNVFRRPTQTLQLVGGSCLVVLLIMVAFAINQAMQSTLTNSGSERNIIFLGAGSEESIERSEIAFGTDEIVNASLEGITQVMNQSAISPEVHYNGMVQTKKNQQAQALLRGVQHQALWVHRKVRLLEGKFPQSGEVMVGRLAHHKLGLDAKDLMIGEFLEFNKEKLRIVGVFDARGTVMEAEIWIPLLDLMTYIQRDTLSCVVLSAANDNSFADAEVFAKTRLDLELVALKESTYYAKISSFYAPIRWMAWTSAILISIGAFMGGLNTLFATFSARIKEFGALQAIGFSRFSIFFSLSQEAMFTGFIAATLSIFISVLFLEGLSFPFSIGVFTVSFDQTIILSGVAAGTLLGMVGVLPPSWKCLRPNLPETLRSS